MIDEEATFEKFGYHSYDWKPKSSKKIVAVCDNCGKVRLLRKAQYSHLCHLCALKQKHSPNGKSIETTCLYCGKRFKTIPSRAKIGHGKYCSSTCKALSQRRGRIDTCSQCGKEIYRSKTKLANKNGVFCCRACMGKWASEHLVGKNSPSYKGKKSRICPICGKEFKTYNSTIEFGRGIYCSRECAFLAKKTGEIVKCQYCGKEFYACKSRLEYGHGKYCSISCSRKANPIPMPNHHTIPERIFEDICEKNEIGTEYTGIGSIWIKNINPDFVYYNGRKRYAIFINGDYWHGALLRPQLRESQRPEYQIKTCKQHRWIPIIIWESDLKREDAEAFVLNLLKKKGILA